MSSQTNTTTILAAVLAGAALLFGGLALAGAFDNNDLNIGEPSPAVEVNLPDTIEIGGKKKK